MLSPGDKVKDCEVIAPLGSGGMARLYLARRRGVGGFSRLVTLKLVHQHLLEDENIIRLFLDEARISAHIAHPNVVHVEEVGEYEGSYFIAMEYVHGVSLAELLARLTERRLRLRPKLCVWLAAQIAEALHAAHEAKGENGTALGIVHRDVSPQNVLIGHTGHVKLIDFGIAKSQAEADPRAGRRPVLGKLRYMSPEQLRLERADRRTDVYALGVMLWEMLAGRNLLRCQRFDDERDWTTRENPPPPSKYSAQSTPSLDRVVLKAIAYEASERYDSAFQFRAALLRADPGAVKLDAPMVAALMRSMLGDELDRRRASWPSEVAGELGVEPDVTTSQHCGLEELTAENFAGAALNDSDEIASDFESGCADAPANDVQDMDDERTDAIHDSQQSLEVFAKDSSALADARADLQLALASASVSYDPREGLRVENAVIVQPSRVVRGPRERTLLGMPMAAAGTVPQSSIDTFKCPPVTVRVSAPLSQPRALRAAGVGFLCLMLGVFVGAFLSATPLPETKAAPQAAAQAPAKALERDPFFSSTPPSEAEVARDSEPRATADAGVHELSERERRADASAVRGARLARKESRIYGTRRGAWRAGKQTNKPGSSSSSKAASSRKPNPWLVRSAD